MRSIAPAPTARERIAYLRLRQPGAFVMISIAALHVPLYVEPYHAGSPEPRVPSPRIDTQGRQRGPQASAEPASQEAVTAASGLRPPVESRARARQPAGRHSAGRRSTAATATATAALAGTLPDAYIGTPQGDLRSDPHDAGVLTDESGQRYVAVGQHDYAIRYDPANRTWRIVQPRDPTKPGIPVRLDPASQWRIHHDIWLAGAPCAHTRR